MYWFYLFIGATFLTGLIAVLALPHSFSQVSHLILASNWPLLCQMRGAMFITECLLCALPRPHYAVQSLRLGSTGPSEEVRPRQKTSKVRHPMRWFSRPKFLISRWKYIVRRHRRGGKVQKNAHFSFSGQKRHFLQNCSLKNSKFSSHGGVLGLFETLPSSEVLEEFLGTFCTLYSRKLCFEKEINVFTSKYIVFLRHFKHLEIGFSARLEICVGFCHLLLINWFYLREPIHEPVDSVMRIAFKN